MSSRDLADSGQSATTLRKKSFANRKQTRTTKGKSTTAALLPVFKRRNNSFSTAIEGKDLLLCYYKLTLTRILKCTGLGNVEIRNILAQIDFLLNDEQHEKLRTSKILDNKATKNLKVISEETINVLKDQEKTRAAVKIQSKVRGWLVRKKLKNLSYKDKGIIRIRATSYMDFIRSDEAYLETLNSLVNDFVLPLQQNATRLDIGSAAIHYLVRDIENLFEFNQKFFAKLCTVAENSLYPVVLSVGDVVVSESADLRSMYLAYANNYIPRIETLRHLQTTNSRFQAFLTEKESTGELLEDLFELPLQYLQVLAARLRMIHSCSVPVLQDETFSIGRCIGVVESIDVGCTRILDEQTNPEAFENIKQTLIVELSLEGLNQPLLGTPKRKLVKEGSVRLAKKKTSHHIYLFNDMIVLAEKMANSLQYNYLRTIYPYELTIEPTGSKIQLRIGDSSGNSSTETLTFKNGRNDWLNALVDFVETYQKNCVFGVALDTVIEREQIPDKIPFVLAITMKYLRSYGLNTEGIFRVPGDGFKIETFQRVFDSGATEVDFRGCSVHDVSGILKSFLRALPVPLVPYEYYPVFVSIQNDLESKNRSEENYIDSIAAILIKLPNSSRHVLHKLIEFLQEVCEHEKQTKMGTNNIAMVFTPNVIRPLEDTIDTAMQSLVISKLFEYLIIHFKSLMKRAIELDPRVAYYYDQKDDKTSKLEKKKSRYSMDAFDPLLCNEIPLPVTMTVPKRALRLPRRDSFRKSPKKKFPAKISPRDEGSSPSGSDITEELEVLEHRRRSSSLGTLEAAVRDGMVKDEENRVSNEKIEKEPDVVLRNVPLKRRKSQHLSLSKPSSGGSFWSILSPRNTKKK